MPQSLSKIYIHVVFSTKHHKKLIAEHVRGELQKYIIGCLSNIKSYVEEIYANPEHIHILCTLPRTINIAQIISKIKAPSSKWMKTKGISNFEWQDGYAAFSVSASSVNAVKRYILNQPDHHKKQSFKEELITFFENYGVDFDERYVWD